MYKIALLQKPAMSDSSQSPHAEAQAARSARRNARRLWRRDMLARAASGESRQQLAEAQDVSLSTIQRALVRARAERPPESREAFVAAQRDRLEKAVRLAEARIADGDLAAAYVLIQLIPLLESFDNKQRCLAAF
jgi:hypothetical protein